MSLRHVAWRSQTDQSYDNFLLWMLQPNVASLRQVGFPQNNLARHLVNAVLHEQSDCDRPRSA